MDVGNVDATEQNKCGARRFIPGAAGSRRGRKVGRGAANPFGVVGGSDRVSQDFPIQTLSMTLSFVQDGRIVWNSDIKRRMSEMGQKRLFWRSGVMSALTPKAICR